MIRKVNPGDAEQISNIYNYYVRNTIITFEETPLSIVEVEKWINEATTILPWLVFEEHENILGYAHASNWKTRCAYRNSVETTVYLNAEEFGKGIGTKLYSSLLYKLKQLNYHAVIGGISLPNEASIALHEKFGFKKIGHFKEVGNKFNRWIDVGYWQLLLDNYS